MKTIRTELDLPLIDKRKQMMDSRGHYSRPELLSLQINRGPKAPVHERELRAEDPNPFQTTASSESWKNSFSIP